jgi:hypothetical protein
MSNPDLVREYDEAHRAAKDLEAVVPKGDPRLLVAYGRRAEAMRALQRDAEDRKWSAWQALSPEERRQHLAEESAQNKLRQAEYADTKATELRQEAEELRRQAAEALTDAYLLDRSPTGAI